MHDVPTGDLLNKFKSEIDTRIAALDKDRTLTHPVREARKKEAQRSLNKLVELRHKLIKEWRELEDLLADDEIELDPPRKTDTYSDYLRDK